MIAERERLARKRLLSVLSRHIVASMRTLEQKISDGGPGNQRINPHVLTPARDALIGEGVIAKLEAGRLPWFHLAAEDPSLVQAKLDQLLPVHVALQRGDLPHRTGQCLEIAIYRALLSQDRLEHFGRFRDLDADDDSTLYSKEEPPQSISGRQLPGDQRLDFLVRHPTAGWAGIEAKNTRPWLYLHGGSGPNPLIAELLHKCLILDCVPVFIGRRIPFVASKLLRRCGVVVHETYRQLMPEADRAVAEQAKHKNLLGYHDIRIGNVPDERLTKFIGTNLPQVLPVARAQFDRYKDLLAGFAYESIGYKEFAARVRRRTAGTNEDFDEDEEDGFDDYL